MYIDAVTRKLVPVTIQNFRNNRASLFLTISSFFVLSKLNRRSVYYHNIMVFHRPQGDEKLMTTFLLIAKDQTV